MQNEQDYLTRENIRITARTLRALDAFSETIYLTEHASVVDPKLRGGDASVAELVNDLSTSIPSYIMLADGHGYRLLLTILANVLIACNRTDLAEEIIESQDDR